jgi:hypothetical protein
MQKSCIRYDQIFINRRVGFGQAVLTLTSKSI